jgi:hypothetical protein
MKDGRPPGLEQSPTGGPDQPSYLFGFGRNKDVTPFVCVYLHHFAQNLTPQIKKPNSLLNKLFCYLFYLIET